MAFSIAKDIFSLETTAASMKPIELNEVIQKEREQLLLRRQKMGFERGTPDQPNWFGIALSGGGIRSATINLGFLRTLNKYSILQKADYLSSVSGGGYTHSYVQATAKETGDFGKLFSADHIDAMRSHGEYMVPRTGFLGKNGNLGVIIVAFLVSWVMTLISPVIVLGMIYFAYQIVVSCLGLNPFAVLEFMTDPTLGKWFINIALGLTGLHFLGNIVLNYNLSISKQFNRAETILAGLGLLLAFLISLATFKGLPGSSWDNQVTSGGNLLLLFVIGFFTNPNALSFHRFYRKQLADLFLKFSGSHKNMPLEKVFDAESDDPKDYIAPYPLFNTCLNLMNPGKDAAFQGTKTSDYFLLSPFYCGSKLVGYVPTSRYWDYKRMTLPAAATISAAAVNPGMGIYSSRMLSVLMTVFNFRLGFWTSNPSILVKARAIVWWPTYFFYELLGRIGSDKKMINISDGGHIENLGAYELLRRGCRLIIAVDAGEDRNYLFFDLNNFLIRVRNELGLEIRFRDSDQPEELIRPRPTQVYSKKRFAVADVYKCWEEVPDETAPDGRRIINYSRSEREKNGSVGTFVYVKSSVRAPEGKPDLDKRDLLKYGTYKYKIYHPDFPHESTSDQFFDEIQWEAYFQLGRYIGAEVLGVPDLETAVDKKPSVDDLLAWFDYGHNCFQMSDSEYEAFKQSPRDAGPTEAEVVKYEM